VLDGRAARRRRGPPDLVDRLRGFDRLREFRRQDAVSGAPCQGADASNSTPAASICVLMNGAGNADALVNNIPAKVIAANSGG